MLVAADDLLGAGAVVRQEDHHRVPVGAHVPKLLEHAADLPVHPVDHRRVNGHLRSLELLLLLGELLPRHGIARFPRADPLLQLLLGEVPARNRVWLERRQLAVDQPHLPHPPPTGIAHAVPTPPVPLPIPGDVFLQRV